MFKPKNKKNESQLSKLIVGYIHMSSVNNNHKREMREKIIKQQCVQRNLRQKRREYHRNLEQYNQQNKKMDISQQENTCQNEAHDEFYTCLEKMFIHEKKHFIMLNRIVVWIIYTISQIFLTMTNILDAVMDTFIENVFCSIILLVFSYAYTHPVSTNAIIDNINIPLYIQYIHKDLLCYI
jgi:hypothetical protein